QEDAELLEGREVRLQRRDAPEFRRRVEAVAHVEHEAARGRADGAELDDLQLAAEGEREDLARDVDLERDVGLDLHQRLAEGTREVEDDAAGQLDEERLRLRDRLER